MPHDLSFSQLVKAMQARSGLLVKLTSDDPTRERARRRSTQGVVKPALDDRSELLTEDNGSLVFRLAPAEWYVLHPGLVTAATEEPDRLRLRVEMGPITWTIETFADQPKR